MKLLLVATIGIILSIAAFVVGHKRGMDIGEEIMINEVINMCTSEPNEVVIIKIENHSVFECTSITNSVSI